jgi:transposase
MPHLSGRRRGRVESRYRDGQRGVHADPGSVYRTARLMASVHHHAFCARAKLPLRALDRTRHLFIRQQTSVINAIRAHLAEFGIVAPVGRNGVEQLLDVVADVRDKRLPEIARACLLALGAQLRTLKAQILNFDREIMACHRSNATSKRLDEIPGVGPALAHRFGRQRRRSKGLPVRSRFFCVDRARAQATLEWR